jgi:putative hydrolase of the HAD superfamily
MVHFVFDVDNTLYSFEQTGFGAEMHNRIAKYMIDNLGFEEKAAYAQSAEYYKKYGLTAAGLHFDHAIDLREFCRFVNQCSYGMLKADPGLCDTIVSLRAAGHEVWYMTNADLPHAESVLAGLGLAAADPTYAERLFDCFSQWEQSEPAMQNKPLRGAYEAMQRRIGADHTRLVMIDDAPANLAEPLALGWQVVWVSHGREWSCEDGAVPLVTIQNMSEFPLVLSRLVGNAVSVAANQPE